MLQRCAQWPEKLATYLGERQGLAFEWGRNDCALFACGAIEAMTGEDPGYEFRRAVSPGQDGYRGRYASAAGAVRVLAWALENRGALCPAWKCQPDSLLAELARRMARNYGMELIAPALAQRGDVALIRRRNSEPGTQNAELTGWTLCLGVIGLRGLPVAPGPQGLVEYETSAIALAWHF